MKIHVPHWSIDPVEIRLVHGYLAEPSKPTTMPTALLEHEVMLVTSDDRTVELTTVRLRQRPREQREREITSIFLENISCIQVTYHSQLIFLYAAILAGAAGLLFILGSREQGVGVFLLLACGIAIALYLRSRKHMVQVASNGGARIMIVTESMPSSAVHEFVEKVERAKYTRIALLHQR